MGLTVDAPAGTAHHPAAAILHPDSSDKALTWQRHRHTTRSPSSTSPSSIGRSPVSTARTPSIRGALINAAAARARDRDAAAEAVAAAEGRLASAEETSASLRGQIERKEAQLNSGEGLTSRDLMALQEEIAGLRSLLEQAADAEFAALEAEEEAEAEVARIDREIAALKERVLQGRARLEDDVAQIIAQRREIQAERDALFAPLADDLKEAYERARSHGGYAVMGMRPDGSTGAGVRFSPLEVARIRALPDDALYVSEDYDCIVVRLEG